MSCQSWLGEHAAAVSSVEHQAVAVMRRCLVSTPDSLEGDAVQEQHKRLRRPRHGGIAVAGGDVYFVHGQADRSADMPH